MRSALLFPMLLVPALALADAAGGVTWKVPSGWKADAPRPMRAATYKVPAENGDAEGGECAVFYFGAGQGGSVDENLKRWYGQFEQPDKRPSGQVAKVQKRKVNGMEVTVVELAGTYLASMGPMSPTKTPKPGYRMLGAIAEGSSGPVFVKCTGPSKTMEGARKGFESLVASFARSQG